MVYLRFLIAILLLLHPLVSKGNITSAKINLPSNSFEPGYIQITPQDKLFYLLIKSKAKNAPLVLYFAGGPGSPSTFPAFLENGPWKLDNPFSHDTNFKLVKNPQSWDNLANIVFLDQPRYTGYSINSGVYLTSHNEVGQDFLTWLKLFYQRYPEFCHRSLYLAGESYGGAYIGEFSHQILEFNKSHPQNTIPLVGLFVESGVIGDDDRFGLDVSPNYQLMYLCDQHLLPEKSCSFNQKSNIRATLNQCVNEISTAKKISPKDIKISDLYTSNTIQSCREYLQEVVTKPQFKSVKIPNTAIFPQELRDKTVQMAVNQLDFLPDSQVRHYFGFSPNPFNIQLANKSTNGYPPWGYDIYKITEFFNSTDIKSWLGKGIIPSDTKWQFANFKVALTLTSLNTDRMPLESYYAEALDHHLKVMFIYGKDDYHMNYLAAQVISNQIFEKAYHQNLFDHLPASSLKSLSLSDNQNSPILGEYKKLHDFTFVQVNNAGHTVGMDQPEIIYSLFRSFLTN